MAVSAGLDCILSGVTSELNWPGKNAPLPLAARGDSPNSTIGTAWPKSGSLRALSSSTAQQDHGAQHDLLRVALHSQQIHAVLNHRDDKGADERAENPAGTARQTRPPDHHGGDHVQLVHDAHVRCAGIELRGLNTAAQAGRQGTDDIDEHDHNGDRNAGQSGRLLVPAHGIDVASHARVRHEDVCGQHRARPAGSPCSECPAYRPCPSQVRAGGTW